MKVKDFLEKYENDSRVKIIVDGKSTFRMYTFYDKDAAISKFGYYRVRKWIIRCGELFITIQSQF